MAKLKLLEIRVDGLDKFKRELSKYGKFIDKTVTGSLQKSAQDIVTDAKSQCIIPTIASGISMQKVDNRFVVTTEGVESAYLEFGTGNYAKALLGPYPKDWVDMARTFFINGLGRTPASPYLFPAYQQNAGEAIIEIIDKIEGH